MINFEQPKIEIVKFACDSEAITTSTYVVDIDNSGYTGNITVKDAVDGSGAFLDGLLGGGGML